jgi:TRAP transporter TAXI family solute receptor
MKKQAVFVALVLLGAAVVLAGVQPAMAEKVFISIGTGGTGGTYFSTGGAVADLISKECKTIKSATAEVTAASVENAKLVNSGEADMGLIAWISIVGDKLTDQLPNLRTLWWIHGSDRQWIVPAESPIQSPRDFKGKKVVVGAPASATEVTSQLELDFFGLSYKDITPAYLSFSEGVEALKDNRVDVALVMAGFPNASVTDVATLRKVRILNFSKDDLEALEKKYPFCPPVVIPAGTYPGQDQDVHTFTTPGPMAINKDIPEETAYEIVKAVHQNQAKLAASVHAAFSLWRFDPSVGALAPLHPGAARYYKEIGLLK